MDSTWKEKLWASFVVSPIMTVLYVICLAAISVRALYVFINYDQPTFSELSGLFRSGSDFWFFWVVGLYCALMLFAEDDAIKAKERNFVTRRKSKIYLQKYK